MVHGIEHQTPQYLLFLAYSLHQRHFYANVYLVMPISERFSFHGRPVTAKMDRHSPIYLLLLSHQPSQSPQKSHKRFLSILLNNNWCDR